MYDLSMHEKYPYPLRLIGALHPAEIFDFSFNFLFHYRILDVLQQGWQHQN